MSEKSELEAMKEAAEILGAIPNGALGTQEPVYRAYSILAIEIERQEALQENSK